MRAQPCLEDFHNCGGGNSEKSLKLNNSSNSENALNNIEGAPQNTDINSQPQLHAEFGAFDTIAPQNGAADETIPDAAATTPDNQTGSIGSEVENELDSLAAIQGWSDKDLADAKYIHETFTDVMAADELHGWIADVYGSHEECDKWTFKAVFETYGIVRNIIEYDPKFTLSQEQRHELVMVLWESRANIPDEGPAIELVALRDLEKLVSIAQVAFDELYTWKILTE